MESQTSWGARLNRNSTDPPPALQYFGMAVAVGSLLFETSERKGEMVEIHLLGGVEAIGTTANR